MHMPNKWLTFIDRRITLGNLVTIVVVILAWAISGTVWYTQVDGHIADIQIHQTIEQKQRTIDDRVHLLVDPSLNETNRRLTNIERATDENTKLLNEIKGRLERR